MAKVLPLRPSVHEIAHNIATAFSKIDHVDIKTRSMRVEIGRDLIELKQRIEAGEGRRPGEPEEFWAWIKLRVNRTVRDMRKCIALAREDDPEAAAEQEREERRESMREHRARKADAAERSHGGTPAEVVRFDPVERALDQIRGILAALNEDERRQVIIKLKEKYPW